MNTINRIENALKAINQATFQTLVNHLLYLKGNRFVGAPGAVVGKDKTSKGAPDSFFVNGDKFIFVECTTQERVGNSKSFYEKLSSDIEHCFQESKNPINKENIEKVILACNEKIGVEEFSLLHEKVKANNSSAELELITIQSLSMDLFEFPKLASEYLSIQIVKGDIYSLEEFLLKTNKGLQPSLTNEFIGREEELKTSVEALKKYDILLLSGGAGVGKSKLAVQILEEFSKDDYVPIVIQSSGVSLWDDYQHLFSHGKQHIMLFDDANKSVNNLEYLLNKIEDLDSCTVKLIVTSRDYVKGQVSNLLYNYSYTELNVPDFKDEEIGKIIVAALPNLKYHSEIKRKIIELSRGNARVALMATYSVTPDSETNYLKSPVLLYEKYFKNISKELDVFKKPIVLKSLAIVSFFGVLDRNNETLKTTLLTNFEIEWNDLWSAIMELHESEILDVYSDEIVKVSDQVLATYAFYKCFIDEESAVINYAKWITVFMKSNENRLRVTLIDVNNTFDYNHIKELVLPHLNEVLKQVERDEDLYQFYKIFWFYRGIDCLLYLKKWIISLPQESFPIELKFSYGHNEYTIATEHFDFLTGFWKYSNELLKPSLELTFTLLNKQPSRLPEILKFIEEDFKYKINDLNEGYLRQNRLLDILLDESLDESLDENQRLFATGIFLHISQKLLGWNYTEFNSAKGNGFQVSSFKLYKSDDLMVLRSRILNQFYFLFDSENDQTSRILQKIIYPEGKIDKSIYVDELPIYQRLISDKLDNKQYLHCKFVAVLAKHLTEGGAVFPESWQAFIESDIRKLNMFLKPIWEYREGKSIREFEMEKRQEFNLFVKENDWQAIESMLLNIGMLYEQQVDNDKWCISSAVTNIYCCIARKNKTDIENALRLFFNGTVSYPLDSNIIDVVLTENIMTAKELLSIMDEYDFQVKLYWQSVLIAVVPEEQADRELLMLLVDLFEKTDCSIYIYKMLDYLKYSKVFEDIKLEKPELVNHNVITYFTHLILVNKRKNRRVFGVDFFEDCVSYFTKDTILLKEAYWVQYEIDSHFDDEGEGLKALLDLDKNFIKESIENEKIKLSYSSKLRVENIGLEVLWDYNEYENLIEEILLTILEKAEYFSFVKDDVISLFQFRRQNSLRIERVRSLIYSLTEKYSNNLDLMSVFIETVYSSYRDWFLEYFKFFLTLNKNIEIVKYISFEESHVIVGSWVPVYQKQVEFYQEILMMIHTLPNILDYSDHINYFEQRITWKKNDIKEEQRNDFMEKVY